MKTRSFRILGAAMAALLPACGGGSGTANPAFPVTLLEPSASETFTAPATISLSAVAADPGSVAKVEFLQGDSVVATSTEPPFQATWSDVPAGIHTLVTRATDKLGAQTFSNSVTISVLPPGACPGGWAPIAKVSTGTGIWFVDADRGWVAGGMEILHTVDGGATWVPQPAGTSQEIDFLQIQFVDPDRGWAVGNARQVGGGTVLRTTDGGATWTPGSFGTDTGPITGLVGLWFVDADTGWVVGLGENVLSTTDGGVTWTPLPTRIPGNGFNHAVRFVDRLNGWVLGRIATTQNGVAEPRDLILHTTDGGQTWTEQLRTGAPSDAFAALDFVSATTGWVSHARGPLDSVILFTSDGGATWTEQTYPASSGIWALDFASPTQGWGVGSSGTIIHTEDGGESWTTQQIAGLPDDQPILLDVRFIDANRGWAIRADGLILKTTTGGK